MKGAPGFVAERSVYRSPGRYGGVHREPGGAQAVTAALIDPGCLSRCSATCVPDCLELTGAARGACLRSCRQDCGESCTIDPGPGSTGTPDPTPATCGPGTPCLDSITGASCPCPPGQVCRPRCGPRICEVNALLCFLFPPFGCLPQCSPGLCTTDSFCQPA
jgi:hypothetical protein